MRKLLALCAAVIVILGIVSVNLWRELRAERLLIAELKSQNAQGLAPGPPPAPVQALPQPAPDAGVAPVVSVPVEEARPLPTAVQPALIPAPPPVRMNPPTAAQTEALRTNALLQSDLAATTRVLAWKDRLAIAGQTLSTEQLQALNAAAIAEGRRETEESLAMGSTSPPQDQEGSFRLREENLNRSHETNLRILRVMSSQLTQDQAKALRTQFETGHATRLAAVRAEREASRMSR
jgi:hypothetical protein